MSWVTTLFAPITLRSPIVTPLVTTTFAPHQTLSPMRVGPLLVNPCHVIGLSGSSKRWFESVTKQPFANMQWSPISTRSPAAAVTPMFRNVPSPIRMRASVRGEPDVRLEQRALRRSPGAPLERLEHVPVQGPADERPPLGKLAVDSQAVPGQRVALIPAPLLPPQSSVLHRRSLPDMTAVPLSLRPRLRLLPGVARRLPPVGHPGPAAPGGARHRGGRRASGRHARGTADGLLAPALPGRPVRSAGAAFPELFRMLPGGRPLAALTAAFRAPPTARIASWPIIARCSAAPCPRPRGGGLIA